MGLKTLRDKVKQHQEKVGEKVRASLCLHWLADAGIHAYFVIN
jgi:hypothetical protein